MSFHTCPICHMDCVKVDAVLLHVTEKKGHCEKVANRPACNQRTYLTYVIPIDWLPAPDPPGD